MPEHTSTPVNPPPESREPVSLSDPNGDRFGKYSKYKRVSPVIHTKDIFDGTPALHGKQGNRRNTMYELSNRKSFLERLDNDSFTDHALIEQKGQNAMNEYVDEMLGKDDNDLRHLEFTPGDIEVDSRKTVGEIEELKDFLTSRIDREKRHIEEVRKRMRGTHRDIHGQIGNESDGQMTDDVKRINPHIDRHIIEENRDRPLVPPPDLPPPNYNKHMLHPHVPNYVSQTKESDNNVPVTQSDVLDLEQQLEILRYKFNSLMKDVKPPAIQEKAYDSCIQINDMLSRSREHLHTEPVVRGGVD